jgi:hypothetical protein
VSAPEAVPINTPLFELIGASAISNEQQTALYRALIEREDTILDQLRVAAAQMGLQPGITAHTLCHCGLGTPLTAEHHNALVAQASAEIEEINRQIRERGAGG